MIAPARVTLLDLLLLRYAPEKLAVSSKKTLEAYQQAIRLFARYAAAEEGWPVVYADQLNKGALVSFRAARLKAGVAPATANKDVRHLHALWQYAWDEELIADPPRKVRKLPEPDKDIDAWSTAEISAQLAQGRSLSGTYLDIPRNLWWPTQLMTLHDSGGRITAVMLSEPRDYDQAHGLLKLRWDEQKQRADQVVRLHEQTRRWLDALLEWRYDRLLPWPWDADESWRTLRRHYRRLILRPCGLPTGRSDMFHRVRRTTITYLWDAAGEQAAQAFAGHSHPSVTRRYKDEKKMTQRGKIHASDVVPRPIVPPLPEIQRRMF